MFSGEEICAGPVPLTRKSPNHPAKLSAFWSVESKSMLSGEEICAGPAPLTYDLGKPKRKMHLYPDLHQSNRNFQKCGLKLRNMAKSPQC